MPLHGTLLLHPFAPKNLIVWCNVYTLTKTHGGSWNELTMRFFYCFTAALAVFCGFSNNLAYRTCCASFTLPAQTGQPLFCERARE